MEVYCQYELKTFEFSSKPIYTCKVDNIKITERDTEIKMFIGRHLQSYSSDNVKAIFFDRTIVHHFPRGISKLFPKLTTVVIEKCELKRITKEDLVGLERLGRLYLTGNHISYIPDDLLEGMDRIREISMKSNLILFANPRFMKPIVKSLTFLDLQGNPFLNAVYESGRRGGVYYSLNDLKEIIKNMCLNTIENDEEEGSGSSLNSSYERPIEDSTPKFAIRVDNQIFKIAYQTLAAKSEYFCSLFAQHLAIDEPLEEITLEDFTPCSVKDVLNYVCTGEMPKTRANFIEIYILSYKWGLEELKESTEKKIIEKIKPSNVRVICDLGYFCQSTHLKEIALKKYNEFLADEEVRVPMIKQLNNSFNLSVVRKMGKTNQWN